MNFIHLKIQAGTHALTIEVPVEEWVYPTQEGYKEFSQRYIDPAMAVLLNCVLSDMTVKPNSKA